MGTDWGSLPLGTVIPFIFTSHDAATGANETMSGLALADILCYKGTSLTQRSSTAGYAFFGGDADGLDLDTFTGVNGVSIDTGDDTDAGFYAAGSLYTVVLGPITIDAQTVYTVLGTFRLVAAESVAGVTEVDVTHIAGAAVSTTTAQLGVNVVQVSGDATAADNLENSFDDTAGSNRWTGVIDQGTAQAVTATTIRLRAAAAFADSELIGCWVVITGGTAGVGQVRRITAYSSATDQATVDAWTTTPTGTITYQVLPGAELTADVAKWLGTAAAAPTVAGVPEVDLTHVAGSTTSVSTLASSVATLLADIGGVATAAADGDPTSTDLLFAYIKQLINILIGSVGVAAWPASAAPGNGVSMAEALRAVHDFGAPPTAAAIADAVLDEDMTAHQTQGSLGQAIGDPVADTNTIYKAVVTDPTGATVGTDSATLLTRLGTPSDLGGGATVAANLSDIEGQTDDIGAAGAGLTAVPWNAAWDAEVQSEANDALVAFFTSAATLATLVGTTALTEAYAADGAGVTLAQGIYEIMQTLSEFAISGTTLTVKKRDGTTTAMTFTLDSATAPTSRTRAT